MTGADSRGGVPPGGRPIWNRGFTLLELAVSAALASVLLAAAGTVSVRGMTAWRRADSRLQALFQAEKGLARLAEELRNGALPADLPFGGTKEEVRFAAAEEPTRLADLRYRVVRDAAGKAAWVRERAPFPNPEGEEPQAATLAGGVTLFSLEYGAVSEEDGLKAVRWVESWDGLGQEVKTIPKIIRVRLEGTDGQGRAFALTRDIWIPQGTWVTVPNE